MDPIYWSLILMAIGIAVIGLELFVPSAGLLGVLAAVLIISSIITAFFQPAYGMTAGAVMILATCVMLPVFVVLALKIWPNTPIGRRVLIGRVEEQDVLPVGDHYDDLKNMVGRRGIAKSKMIPSGLVIIDGQKFDAVSEGLAIDPGDHIQVIAVRTNKIIVRKIDPAEDVTSGSLEDDVLSKPIDDVFDEG